MAVDLYDLEGFRRGPVRCRSRSGTTRAAQWDAFLAADPEFPSVKRERVAHFEPVMAAATLRAEPDNIEQAAHRALTGSKIRHLCPNSGKNVDLCSHFLLNTAMGDAEELTELVEHLCGMTRLEPFEARRVVEEVLAYLSESPAEFITRRHAELQREGHANAAIFRQLAIELGNRRFTAPALSERQIRRLVYG